MIGDLRLCDLCGEVYNRTDATYINGDARVFRFVEGGCQILVPPGTRTFLDKLIDVAAEIGQTRPSVGEVSASFYDAMTPLLDAIIADLTPDPLLIGGHSLGGAWAQALAAQLRLRGVPIARLTTFEAPALGACNGVLAPAPGPDYAHHGDRVVAVPFRLHPRPLTWFTDPALPEFPDLLQNHHLTTIRPALVRYLAANPNSSAAVSQE